ncbi:hypothetical protein [Desulfovibrio cuneatus]|uniref:hypothetical protein n=1 Tax=Desulfovibrio cuneatus TaxID=159728 RepID=UPI00047F8AC0|nr:hypothetical protein [Desulfovibrio cuneatus]
MPLILFAFMWAMLFFPINAFADDFTPERFDCSNSQRYYVVQVPSHDFSQGPELAQTYTDANRIDLAHLWQQGMSIWNYGGQRFCNLGLLPVGKSVTVLGDDFGARNPLFIYFSFRKLHVFDANEDGILEIALIEYVDGGFYQVTVLGGCPESYYIPVAQFVARRVQQNGIWIQPENFVFGDYHAWPEFVVEAPAKLTGNLYSKQKNWAVRQWRFTTKAGKYTETVIKRLPDA